MCVYIDGRSVGGWAGKFLVQAPGVVVGGDVRHICWTDIQSGLGGNFVLLLLISSSWRCSQF